jgi:hypothetical protein
MDDIFVIFVCMPGMGRNIGLKIPNGVSRDAGS